MRKNGFNRIVFEWAVTRNGYLLKEVPIMPDSGTGAGLKRQHLVVTDGLPLELSGINVVVKKPLYTNDGLFLEFANLEPKPDKILGFANRFGLLGGPCQIRIDLSAAPGRGPVVEGVGESVETWQREIAELRQVVNLWEQVKRGNSGGADAVHQGASEDKDWKGSASRLNAAVNERIGKQVFVEVGDDSNLLGVIKLRPLSLISALWMQLAVSIAENRRFKKCSECRKWFDSSPGAARKTKTYCSDACRSKAYRSRREETRRLHAEGMPTTEIAGLVGADVRNVKRWIIKK